MHTDPCHLQSCCLLLPLHQSLCLSQQNLVVPGRYAAAVSELEGLAVAEPLLKGTHLSEKIQDLKNTVKRKYGHMVRSQIDTSDCDAFVGIWVVVRSDAVTDARAAVGCVCSHGLSRCTSCRRSA